MGSFMLSLM